MLKSSDIFGRQEGQGFDLTQGVDVINFFNEGIAGAINGIEQASFQDLDIESKVDASTNTAEADIERSTEQTQANISILSQRQEQEPQFGFQKKNEEVAPIVGNFESESNQFESDQSEDGDFDPADFTFNREARKDNNGNLTVYKPPTGDGGGSFEVAGITAKFQKTEATRLKSLIESGNHVQAEKEAKAFFRKRASPFVKHASQKGLQLQLADTVHHRGESGLRQILQRATGSKIKSHSALIAKLDKDPQALNKFNKARVDHEIKVVDRGRSSREQFREGLMNRFNQAHKAALLANT